MKTSSSRAALMILALAAAGLTVTATGCGDGLNDCQEAKALLDTKIHGCFPEGLIDYYIPDPVECSDEAGTLALCQATAFSETSCGCTFFSSDITRCPPADALTFKAAYGACK